VISTALDVFGSTYLGCNNEVSEVDEMLVDELTYIAPKLNNFAGRFTEIGNADIYCCTLLSHPVRQSLLA
jgi:hypothetical protein